MQFAVEAVSICFCFSFAQLVYAVLRPFLGLAVSNEIRQSSEHRALAKNQVLNFLY